MPKGKILMGKAPGMRPGPVKPKPKGNGMLDTMLPGKPGDFKNKKMPSYLRKPKKVIARRGGK